MKFLNHEPTEKRFSVSGEDVHEVLWKTVFEQSPIGFALWDKELKYVRINKALAKMNGFSDKAYLSKISRQDLETISEDTISILQNVIKTCKPLVGREVTTRMKVEPDILRTWLVNYHPVFEDGKVQGVLASSEDITERKRIEDENQRVMQELRHREARFESLILATGTTYWSADSNGEIVEDVPMWNRLTGQSTRDMQELGWREVIHPDDVEETTHKWLTAITEKKPYESEFRLKTKNGTYRYFLSRAVPVFDPYGRVREWVGVNVDIDNQKQTDRKLLEAVVEREHLLEREKIARLEAEEANNSKDDFLATLSHELRTPLTATLGWVKMLCAGQLDDEEIPHALETIARNTETQNQLIEDLLDVSRIVSGKIRLEVRPVNIDTILKSALDAILPSAEIKNIQVFDDIPPHLPTVSADLQRMRQIFSNLLNNAVKFTHQDGKIFVSLFEQNNCLLISIRDNGMGINAEFLPRIFERFRQADSTKSRRSGGLGLGLAIVRNLTEAQGGTVEVASKGENKGSTFTLRFPILGKNLKQKPIEKQQNVEASPPKLVKKNLLNKLRLLVVDDDNDNREMLKTLLSHHGAKVILAESAEEGMQFLLECSPDILISDIGMPNEDGYQFITKIRALPKDKGGEIPAIALTAFAKIEDAEKALSVGFQRHIAKPIEPTDFVQTIAELAKWKPN